jgi:hypothetical protein
VPTGKLRASTCEYRGDLVAGVFLTVPGGGAGARCDGAAPAVLAARRIHTYLDRQTGTSWIFGALPASARQVTVSLSETGAWSSRRFAALPTDPRAVASVPGAPEVLGVTATDARGEDVLRCEGRRCSP